MDTDTRRSFSPDIGDFVSIVDSRPDSASQSHAPRKYIDKYLGHVARLHLD